MRRTGGSTRVGIAAICLALIAAACGGSDDDDSGTGQTGGQQTGGAQARPGGVIRIPLTEPASIDPYQARESEGNNVSSLLFTGLVTYDGNPELKMQPGVAERWAANPDCTEWTFNLRRGTKFHNGEDVDANSFIRGWTRASIGTAASQVAYHLGQIQGFKALNATPPQTQTLSGASAPDPYTLVARLDEPDCEFDKQLVHPVASPVPSVAGAANNTTFNEAPVGNGPFMMKPGTKWEHNQRISLVRNDNYFGTKPLLDGIEYPILQNIDAHYRAFQAGEVDFSRVPSALLQQAQGTYQAQGSWIKSEQPAINYIVINAARAPFNNPDARKAMSMAIDRDAINKGVYQGLFTTATAFITPPFGSFHQAGICGDWCKHDVNKAKEFAARGGLTPGTRIKLGYNNDGGHEALVQAWKDQLERNLGLVVELDGVPFSEHLQKRDRGDFDIARAGWSTDYPSADGFTTPLLSSVSTDNDGKYSNPQVDTLLRQAKTQRNDADRLRITKEIERIAIGQDLALAPTFYRTAYRVFDSSKWTGLGLDFFERPTLLTASQKP